MRNKAFCATLALSTEFAFNHAVWSLHSREFFEQNHEEIAERGRLLGISVYTICDLLGANEAFNAMTNANCIELF
ncbi:MAG: hypothetical protein RLN62_05640 [Rickettsiales bacterium]